MAIWDGIPTIQISRIVVGLGDWIKVFTQMPPSVLGLATLVIGILVMGRLTGHARPWLMGRVYSAERRAGLRRGAAGAGGDALHRHCCLYAVRSLPANRARAGIASLQQIDPSIEERCYQPGRRYAGHLPPRYSATDDARVNG